jgi:predicted DNA-binding transcriptional regulator AlpA
MDTTDTPESLVDAAVIGTVLGIAKSTVYDQAAKGRLPHVRLWTGARRPVIRFRMSEIEKFIRDRTIVPGADRVK